MNDLRAPAVLLERSVPGEPLRVRGLGAAEEMLRILRGEPPRNLVPDALRLDLKPAG